MKQYAPFALRIGIGVIFLFAGITKLLDPDKPIGMLTGLGFPVPGLWAWILIAAEVLCGLAVFLGLWTKWTTIPLMIVMLVAIVTNISGGSLMSGFKDAVILSGLVSIWLSGAGALSVTRN